MKIINISSFECTDGEAKNLTHGFGSDIPEFNQVGNVQVSNPCVCPLLWKHATKLTILHPPKTILFYPTSIAKQSKTTLESIIIIFIIITGTITDQNKKQKNDKEVETKYREGKNKTKHYYYYYEFIQVDVKP